MSLSLKKLQEITTCQSCHGTYDDPRWLPCTHTFCLACISESKSSGKVFCTDCGSCFKTPDDDIRGFPRNVLVDHLMESAVRSSPTGPEQVKDYLFQPSIDPLRGAVTRKLQVFTTATAKHFAQKICLCVDVNNLNFAKMLMENIRQVDRAAVMRESSVDYDVPLQQAVYRGRTDFVEFFLDDCNADIEQLDTCTDSDTKEATLVTPLWCAAVLNKLDIVKCLVQRGANLNAIETRLQSTVVLSACNHDSNGSHSDVIRYLVDNGADVNIPNVNGWTCLHMVSTSAELCSYLIEKGAKINSVTCSGWTTLHYAVLNNCLDVVKLLIGHGADANLRDENGDDALRLAINWSRKEITEYLLRHKETDIVANAYALMGVQYVYSNEFSKASECWRLANLQLTRVEHGATSKLLLYHRTVQCEKWKDMPLPTKPYNEHEFTEMRVRICEEILGDAHPVSIQSRRILANSHAVNEYFQVAIDVCLNAVQRYRSRPHENRGQEMSFLLNLTYDIFAAVYSEVQFSTVSSVFSAIVDELTDTMNQYPRINWSALLDLMEKSISYSYLMLVISIESDDDEKKTLELIRSLVRLQPRAAEGQSLLQVAICSFDALITRAFHSDEVDSDMLELLIKAGESVNLTDRYGNTVLDFVLETPCLSVDRSRRLRDLLLQYGATRDFTG